jgi:hypothetical protein
MQWKSEIIDSRKWGFERKGRVRVFSRAVSRENMSSVRWFVLSFLLRIYEIHCGTCISIFNAIKASLFDLLTDPLGETINTYRTQDLA